MALFDLGHSMPAASRVGDPSLRADATGFSMFYDAGRVASSVVPETYDQGFTVEYALKVAVIGERSVAGGISRIVPSVHSHSNVQASIFELAFDNWNFPGSGTVLTPCFTMLNGTSGIYKDISDRVSIHGEARGFKPLVVGDTYHILGTLRASDGRCDVYVNGELEGTTFINMAAFIDTGDPQTGLDRTDRSLRQYFEIGTRFLDGAWRVASSAGSANIDNVRWYLQHFDAAQAAIAASQVAFTPCPPNEDASEYFIKSDDVNPEPRGGSSRRDVRFRPDGLRAWTQWTTLSGGFDTHQYDVSPAWSTTGWTPSGNVLRVQSLNRSMTWHDNGTKLTFLSRWFASNRRIDTFDMSATPYDISSGLGPGFASLTAITGPGEYMVRFSLDGLKMFTDIGATSWQRYNLAVAHDISSSTGVDQSFNYGAAGAGSTNTWDFSPDHKKIYIHTGGNLLGSFDLTARDDISAPFNFSTGVSVDLPTNLQVARGLNIRPGNNDFILLADQNNLRIRCWET